MSNLGRERHLLANYLISGGELTIDSPDITKASIAKGICIFADLNGGDDLENIQYKRVPFGPFNNFTPAFINVNDFTTFSIDIDGNLIQQPFPPTIPDFRIQAFIGAMVHDKNLGININADNSLRVVGTTTPANIADLFDGLGLLNYNRGLVYSGNIDLTFKRTSGSLLGSGVNFKTDNLNPNLASLGADDPRPVNIEWRDGAGGFNVDIAQTVLDVAHYDDGTGGVSQPSGAVLNMRWQAFRILDFPGGPLGITGMQYGQSVHSTALAALIAAFFEDFEFFPQFGAANLRGYILARGGATDLSDPNDAVFKMVTGKFGIL